MHKTSNKMSAVFSESLQKILPTKSPNPVHPPHPTPPVKDSILPIIWTHWQIMDTWFTHPRPQNIFHCIFARLPCFLLVQKTVLSLVNDCIVFVHCRVICNYCIVFSFEMFFESCTSEISQFGIHEIQSNFTLDVIKMML